MNQIYGSYLKLYFSLYKTYYIARHDTRKNLLQVGPEVHV